MEENIDEKLLNNMKLAFNTFSEKKDDKILNYLKNNTDEFLDVARKFYNKLEIFDGLIRKNYKNYMTISESLDLCREFLSNYFPEYLGDFEKLLNDGTINLIDADSEEFDKNDEKIAYSYYEGFLDENGNIKNNINIVIYHTLEDTFTIMHEFFHYTNSNFIVINNELYTATDREIFTENLSRFIEYLVYDFLKSKNYYKEDNIRHIKYCIDIDTTSVDNLGYTLYTISKMREVKYSDLYKEDLISVKEFKIKSKLYNINKKIKDDNDNEELLKEKELVEQEINELAKQKENLNTSYNKVTSSFKYTIGFMLSVIMFYNYKNGIIDLNNIKTYNKKIANNGGFKSTNYVLSEELNTELLLKALDYLKEDIDEYENKSIKTYEKIKS